jgi:ASC-1-like (ASCH) protein
MKEHAIHLNSKPFNRINSGIKTIESRLNDVKRKSFQIGDNLTFINRKNGDRVTSTISALHHFPTFSQLFASLPSEKFGESDSAILMTEIEQFYSETEQKEFGVIGIEFILI